MNLYERAMFVARTFKVKTGRDRAFLATEKYMSEKRSDWAAFQSANRAKVRFEETPCAKELKSLELDKSKLQKSGERQNGVFCRRLQEIWLFWRQKMKAKVSLSGMNCL